LELASADSASAVVTTRSSKKATGIQNTDDPKSDRAICNHRSDCNGHDLARAGDKGAAVCA